MAFVDIKSKMHN